jgi:hypothetical protein
MLYWIVLGVAGFAVILIGWSMAAAITAASYYAVFALGFCYGRTSYALSLIKFEKPEEKCSDSNAPWLINLREPD